MLLLAVLWGLSIPVTKLGLATMPPLTLTALRFAIALPVMFYFVAGRRRLPWPAFPRVAALGLLGIGVGQGAQTLGVVGTSASAGTIVSATIPILVVIFAALRLKQAVSGATSGQVVYEGEGLARGRPQAAGKSWGCRSSGGSVFSSGLRCASDSREK